MRKSVIMLSHCGVRCPHYFQGLNYSGKEGKYTDDHIECKHPDMPTDKRLIDTYKWNMFPEACPLETVEENAKN